MNFIFFVLAAIMIAAFVPAYAGTAAVNPATVGAVTGSNCGGNCPGGCSSCPCGTSTSYQDIGTWCSKYSWNQVCVNNVFCMD